MKKNSLQKWAAEVRKPTARDAAEWILTYKIEKNNLEEQSQTGRQAQRGCGIPISVEAKIEQEVAWSDFSRTLSTCLTL